MSSWLIALIGIAYFFIGIDLILTGKTGLGIAFLGYSLGNVGLYLEAING